MLWATGFRADYSWLDSTCSIARARSATTAAWSATRPGLYRIGLNFLRRRKSSFIHGAEDDARDIVEHLADHVMSRSGLTTG